MSKPEDIPQDVLASAWDEYETVTDAMGVDEASITIAIARAIMAEREACAEVAEAETLTGTPPAWADPMQIAVVAGTVTATAKSIASAIRKRGEP